jgi:hypothetical protein
MGSMFKNTQVKSLVLLLYSYFSFVGAIQKIPYQEDQLKEVNEIDHIYDDYYMRFLSDSNSSLSEFIDNTRIDSYTKSDWIFIGCIVGLAPIVVGLTFFFMFTTVTEEDEDGTQVRRRRIRKPRVNKKYHQDLEESSESEYDENSPVTSDYSEFEETDVEQQQVVKYIDSSSHSDYSSYDEQSF